jgi:hypothetical protein
VPMSSGDDVRRCQEAMNENGTTLKDMATTFNEAGARPTAEAARTEERVSPLS